MARYWMHNGFLQVEGEKMSKSLGNFVTIRELLGNWGGYSWPGEALRFNMLRTHYRQPMDWTLNGLDESHKILWEWYSACSDVSGHADTPDSVIEPLLDDLNTPAMVSALHKLAHDGNFEGLLAGLRLLGFSGEKSKLTRSRMSVPDTSTFDVAARVVIQSHKQQMEGTMRAGLLGFQVLPSPPPPEPKLIDELIAKRTAARNSRDFEEADRIRDELAKMGVVLKDTKDGTTWEIAR